MVRVRCRVLRTFWQQFKGLMFSKKVDVPLLFVLPQARRFAIHSFFCPPFDAVFLDSQGRVIDVFAVRTVQAWIRPRSEALYLVEGPPGFGSRMKRGDLMNVDVETGWLDWG